MRITPELSEITSLINHHLPRHARGVIEPSEMLRVGASNCFGRLALIGSGLIETGTPESQLSFLISHTHAVEFGEGRHWFGHAELAIAEPDMTLIDAMTQATHRDLFTDTSWSDGHTSQDIVIDYTRQARPVVGPIDWDALRDIEEFTGPPHIYRFQHLFSVHSFAEGIDFYQEHHPFYDDKLPVRIDDYKNKYRHLATSALTVIKQEAESA
jgi:hypothetical protein